MPLLVDPAPEPAPPPTDGAVVLAGAVLLPSVPEAPMLLRFWVVVSVELVLLLAPVGLLVVLVGVAV